MNDQIRLFLEEYKQELAEAAAELRGRPMPGLTEEGFSLFERTGNRLAYEQVYFLRRKYLAVFGMEALLHRKKEDIAALAQIILEICGEFCWALPAHVDRKNDKDWQHTLDLFACETAGALAEIGMLLEDALPRDVQSAIRGEVCARVLEPFEQSAVPCGKWENCDHNWNAVCGSSIGIAALCLLKEEPQRQRAILERICASLHYYIGGFADDGACMEGAGYFTYGMSYYMAFAECLPKELRTKLPQGEKVRRIMEFQQKCYFPGGLSVSFSDGSSRERFRMGLACRLCERDDAAELPPLDLAAHLHTDPCYRWAILYRDYAWTQEYLVRKEEAAKKAAAKSCAETYPDGGAAREAARGQIVLPNAQWSICRSFQTGAGMAAKGGTNGEPHNHNDIGSFHYVCGGEVFLADLGAGEYTGDYFREETRYTIFVNQSFSHNVPIINGQPQKAGRAYACGRFEADGRGRTELEFAGAYGQPELKCLRRVLEFSEEDGSLEVTDLFAGSGKLTVQENLVTPWKPRMENGRIVLRGKKKICVLQTEPGMAVSVQEQTYADHAGETARVYVLRFKAAVTGGRGQARFRIFPEG